ncbi:MAG TPA: NADH-quinone oxidoreductase subunit K [Candidatus Saccharicenans sp.]|jgi:multisubunit Na+/H+ antiporter MnhC subunit|nr:NADH-quinone oxidoreductase subunit K [Candidatus Saccharicenans sp.]MBP6059444.1 NADH-quinone oxidoreductase subunit K [Candidatus Saccharicenans sp.]MBP8600870.1 NADH-quinone oxidoreductase subunit K [Candidatus Saccharicenans sp.]HOE13558.1 NADH-quinone oxidoreductase subunit K [Candidatus Saccharicenans sp.]HOP60353.1 NADH-quinone oxidoreductase subunit K [Candidatus Saccharicenans sp.]
MSNLWFLYLFFSALLIFTGIYCLLTMRNLIKLFIAVEVISKGVSLVIIATGAVKNSILLAQSLAITYIVVEVSLVATALALIINIYKKNKSLDVRSLSKLKG